MLLFAQDAPNPAQTLWNLAARNEQFGRIAQAKLVLLTLARTYDNGPEFARAKAELGAVYIFEEAQTQERAGQTRQAWDSFGTVAQVYPESPLAALAAAERSKLDPAGKWRR